MDCRRISGDVPFALTRAIVRQSDIMNQTNWQGHVLLRAAFHRPGQAEESLSDRQRPDNQLRYYTRPRIERGLRYAAHQIASQLPVGTVIQVSQIPSSPDRIFLQELLKPNKVRLEIQDAGIEQYDAEAQAFTEKKLKIAAGRSTGKEAAEYISFLLSVGDSWSAELIADQCLEQQSVDDDIYDNLGLCFALAGRFGDAKYMWENWAQRSDLDQARADYSLSMMYARHNPRGLIDQDKAISHLVHAWEILARLPETPQVVYERVFNRNGLALLLFRARRLDEAIDMEQQGIESISHSKFANSVHHTVLVSNLARVLKEAGRIDEAGEAFRRAVAMDPKFAEYWQDLASFLADYGNLNEALTAAEQCSRLDPSIPEGHRMVGYLRREAGDLPGARAAYQDAADLGDGDAAVEMFVIAHEMDDAQWIIDHAKDIDKWSPTEDQKVEIQIIQIAAKASLDETFNSTAALQEMRLKHPDNQYVIETISNV